MPAAVHVLTGPAGAGKTARLLERFRAIQADSFDTALWIAPTRRAADNLRPQLGASGFALHLYPFQDFVEEIIRVNDPQAKPLSGLQRRVLAEELVAGLHLDKKLSHFERIIDTRGFAEAVFALLAELKENEIWPEHLARAVGQRGPKCEQCVRIYERYQDQLIRNHLYDLEGRFWYARDLLARGLFRPFERIRAVFVDGFTRFTRTQHEILQALAGRVAELWIALPDEAGDDRVELFTQPRATFEKLRPLMPRVKSLAATAARPVGLAHLERQLFRRTRAVQLSDNAEGVALIEAPGALGETRLVAREIKQLLLDGVAAHDVLVTLRNVQPYADLVREVFTEYGIPVDIEGAEPLLRNPAVATLLRALRLPEDGWPFAGVTALLRSGYFQPDWSETRSDPAVAQHAEALLRLLGEPRGREAYRSAIELWASEQQKGLEDEEADEPRRRRTHELALCCRAFLHRFFQSWDGSPAKAPLVEQAAWLQEFADDLGLFRSADSRVRDRTALDHLFDELKRWTVLEGRLFGERPRDRAQFLRLLGALSMGAGLPRTLRGPGRVPVLSADLVRSIDVPYLFVMGLGERSFPDLSAAEPFFDEADRQACRQADLDLPGIADRMPEEMLRFYQVVTRARRRLTLSYPAVDDKGQDLLPSSFLSALLECFGPNAVPTIWQRMLIERFDERMPLSPAEYRVQTARGSAPGDFGPHSLDSGLKESLKAAAALVQQRAEEKDFGPYDGRLRDPAALAELANRFTPERVLSATALETYIACPFQFFLRNVLRLGPLEEPREEIEQTRRGSAFHLALARLHRAMQGNRIHAPTENVVDDLLAQLNQTVQEHAARAPSAASKVLWELEGERLKKVAARYGTQWQKFVAPWADHGVAPRPEHFEAGFGLPDTTAEALVIRVDDVEVRIGGRIDRVDVAELESGLGFWIIDYKTGKSTHYSAADLVQFRRLQLPLYALAVEDVLLKGKAARPLGLAYWLVTEKGPKTVLPASVREVTSWLEDAARWPKVREQLRNWVATLVRHLRQGDFQLKPRSPDCTETCDYSQVCRINQSRRTVEARTWALHLPVLERPA